MTRAILTGGAWVLLFAWLQPWTGDMIAALTAAGVVLACSAGHELHVLGDEVEQ